ncbi:MAG: TraR/DksA C4-type zinc finger protein [Magnetospirillum sp. WYHS-4]
MADEADMAGDLEQRERDALIRGRQVDTWVPGLAAAATPLAGHDPAVRAGLLAEARLCAACGEAIPVERLRARPDAILCIECQAEYEGP